MRRIGTILAASTAATLGLLTLATGPAAAAAPAPACESGASRFVCDAFGATGPVTWTVTINQSGARNTFTVTTPGSTYTGGCAARSNFILFYSYTAGGVTQTSEAGFFVCNPGDWP
jgi:hypothetical protein